MADNSITLLRNVQIELFKNQSKDIKEVAASKPKKKRVENIRNSDIFVDDNNLYLYVDVDLFKAQLEHKINIEEIKSLQIKYKPEEKLFEMQLPCLPNVRNNETTEKSATTKQTTANQNHQYLWHLKRITDRCQIVIADSDKPMPLEANFSYGFNSNYRGKICSDEPLENDLDKIHTKSPLRRTIDREVDELRCFSQDQYKCDFVELQVPDGHEDPMKYKYLFGDIKWTDEEELILYNLTINDSGAEFENIDTAEIDCGLLNILMAICYDIRSTNNEPTCESGWTRSILSPVLHNFEPMTTIKASLLSFLRRSLIYPLYRNYDLSRRCVEDTIKALLTEAGSEWVLHQLVKTQMLFASNETCNRKVLNRYYINDYLRYVNTVSTQHLQVLARNLKNITFDVFKDNLGLDLEAIETEIVKAIITDISSNDGTSEEDDENEEEELDVELFDDEEDSIEDDESSSSDTEENSVIEQRIEQLKL